MRLQAGNRDLKKRGGLIGTEVGQKGAYLFIIFTFNRWGVFWQTEKGGGGSSVRAQLEKRGLRCGSGQKKVGGGGVLYRDTHL